MAVTQPFMSPCSGGLDLMTSPFELLRKPNVATELKNFEVDNSGGYRRINGYVDYGDTRPEGSNRILGLYPYALGVVACVDTSVYYSEDGSTWLQINKDTTSSGKVIGDMAGTSELDRPNQGQVDFLLMTAPTGRTTTTYGSLNIATGNDALARFRIEGTGASRKYYWEVDHPGVTVGDYLEEHGKHLCMVDKTNAPSTVYYSTNNTDDTFNGTGSGSVTIPDKITGIKSFRDSLFIFAEKSIYALVNINNSSTIATQQITMNLGCISHFSIQEIGGDLIYLSTDGLRTIAGTTRLSDVELGSLSHQIQPLLEGIINRKDFYIFNSIVLKSKNQYRLYYTEVSLASTAQKGIIGTLRPTPETGGTHFEWSTTSGIEVTALGIAENSAGTNVSYHGDDDGYIYIHDSGDTFNGTNIPYVYSTPDIDYGDEGMRKTLHYMLLSIKPEGATDIKLKVSYDFNSPKILQPPLQDVGAISYPTYYNVGQYGTARYGGSLSPTTRINLRGSGTSSSFRFTGADANPPFILTGYYITFAIMDRR